MLEAVNRLAHELFASPDPRADLSWGALEIADASVAVLFEPDHEDRIMRATAIAGITPPTSRSRWRPPTRSAPPSWRGDGC